MNKIASTLAIILLTCSIILTGTPLVVLIEGEESVGELYTFPIEVEEQTYVVTVNSNYSSSPEVSYSGVLKSVSVDFSGDQEYAFCNVTIPTNLIWGELSVYAKGYKMNEADYTQSSNSTHNSVYFLFNYTSLVKDFEIIGTEGVIPEFPSWASLVLAFTIPMVFVLVRKQRARKEI